MLAVLHTACALANHGLGEQPACQDYLHKTAGLLSDPAHVTGELLFDGLETAVAFAIAWVLGRRALRREHVRLDKEHGVIDHGVTTAASQQCNLDNCKPISSCEQCDGSQCNKSDWKNHVRVIPGV